jgi:hypothetical protein
MELLAVTILGVTFSGTQALVGLVVVALIVGVVAYLYTRRR